MGRLNLDDVREQAAAEEAGSFAAKSGGGSDIIFKAGKGINRVRLANFTSEVTGKVMFYRAIKVHQKQRQDPIICGKSPDRNGVEGEKCEHCEIVQQMFDDGDVKAAKEFASRDRMVFLVRPVEKGNKDWRATDKLYQFWGAYTQVGKVIRQFVLDGDEGDTEDYFGPSGMDFKVDFDFERGVSDMYRIKCMPLKKSEDLDPAAFALADGMDLYAADNLEPYNWDGHAPVTPAEEPKHVTVREPATKAPAKKEKAPKAPPRTKAKVLPVLKEGQKYYTLVQAEQYLDYYAFKGWKAKAEEDGDAYFISPKKEVQWEAPTPTAAQAKKATGMKKAPAKRKPAPPNKTGEDGAE